MTIAGLSRRQAFWLMQAGGWATYSLAKLLAFPVTLIDCAWICGKGMLLTLALRAVLLRLERARFPSAGLLAAAGGIALLLALVSLSLSRWASGNGWLLVAGGTAHWLASVEALLYEFLLFMTWTALYLGIRYGLDLRAEQQRLTAALAQAQRARMQMLRYQLNPHFLFNALASLRGLVLEDAARARRVIDDLSGFLRFSLLDGAVESTSLSRELDAVRHYLAIQKVRFEERLHYDVTMDPAVAHVRLPAFLIHPLVENAVKYGMRTTRGEPARIEVSARREQGWCVLEVRNSGRWVLDEPGGTMELDRSGIGLANVRGRLAEQLRSGYAFTIGPAADGVLARLQLDAV